MKIYKHQYIEFTEEFQQFMNEQLSKELHPYKTDYGSYRFDWSIIGGEDARWLFEPYYSQDLQNKFEKNPSVTHSYTGISPIPIEEQRRVMQLVNWLSLNVFEITKMVYNRTPTNRVLLRIAMSKIDHLKIDKTFRHYLGDNILWSYMNRKRFCDEYYYKYVLELPF